MDRVLIFFLIITLLLIGIFDIKKLYIPNRLNLLFLIEAILYRSSDIEIGVIGAGVYTLPLLLFYGYGSDIVGRDVIGFGDIKFLVGAGYLLGYRNFYEIYTFYLVAFISGALYGILLLLKKRDRKKEMPFSPFLIVALGWILWKRI